MELAIGSQYLIADITTAIDKAGQEHLLVVAKGSWTFAHGKAPRPIAAVPLQYADVHTGEPGLSAPLYESDFSLHKPRCDVIFNASAHAPGGKPVTELAVGYRIGAHQKGLRVLGERVWEKLLAACAPGKPVPFTEMPLHYGKAFGGARPCGKHQEQELFDTFEQNPAGIGYSPTASDAKGLPMPCLETLDQRITRPDGNYPPAALSPVARNWLPRRRYGGTYDDRWKRDIFPFLPEDFDERFHQCAPEDQQMDYPKGGEEVVLLNLMRGHPEVRFKLPRLDKVPVRVLMSDYRVEQPRVVVDTLYFEPDEARFSVVWRASVPLKRRIQDVKTVAVGGICKNWWDAKIIGAEGCAGCAKQRSTQEPAPTEEECEESPPQKSST